MLDAPPSADNGTCSIGDGDPRMDLIIGITPFDNASSWSDGDMFTYVPISFIRDWIEEVILLEVIHRIVAPNNAMLPDSM